MLLSVEQFQSRCQAFLDSCDCSRGPPPSEQLQALLEHGERLAAEPPALGLLRGLRKQGHWLGEVQRALGRQGGEAPASGTLSVLRNLMEAGCNVPQSSAVETAMGELQELLTIAERWEEKAQICLEHR